MKVVKTFWKKYMPVHRAYKSYVQIFRVFGHHLLSPRSRYIIQRKFQKIQRKISKVSILKFAAIKLIKKLFNGISLHSWGPDASFDTHIAISRHCKCRVPNVSFMSKMPKMPYLTPMPSNMCHILYGNMGAKRYVGTSGRKISAIKQVLKKFDG